MILSTHMLDQYRRQKIDFPQTNELFDLCIVDDPKIFKYKYIFRSNYCLQRWRFKHWMIQRGHVLCKLIKKSWHIWIVNFNTHLLQGFRNFKFRHSIAKLVFVDGFENASVPFAPLLRLTILSIGHCDLKTTFNMFKKIQKSKVCTFE